MRSEAYFRLSELLDKVEADQEIVITRRGKAVAHSLSRHRSEGSRSRSGNWPDSGLPYHGCDAPLPSCCVRFAMTGSEVDDSHGCAISTPVSSRRSYSPRPSENRSRAFSRHSPPDDLAVSHRTGIEFASLLAREVRIGGLDPLAARKAGSRFETMVGESLVVLLPNPEDFDRARDWLSRFDTGLRAGGCAAHLAIAENRGAEAIYSLDKLIIAAGKTLGLPATAGTVPGYGD